MKEIIFRKWELRDIAALTELRILQLTEEGAETTADITNDLSNFYQRHFADGVFVSWVATVNDKIVAASGISFTEKPPYYSNPTGRIGLLSMMYTVPAYRRMGIAKRLLGLIVNEAKDYGCGSVQITASDMGAHLYQNFGFERGGKFFQYEIN